MVGLEGDVFIEVLPGLLFCICWDSLYIQNLFWGTRIPFAILHSGRQDKCLLCVCDEGVCRSLLWASFHILKSCIWIFRGTEKGQCFVRESELTKCDGEQTGCVSLCSFPTENLEWIAISSNMLMACMHPSN